jgi:hypothetical protein
MKADYQRIAIDVILPRNQEWRNKSNKNTKQKKTGGIGPDITVIPGTL